MIIYQLHEYYGEWEDFRDNIIGSYLRKERAEEEKAKAEQKEKELIEQSKRCQSCPFEDDEDDSANLNDLLTEYPDYCAEAELKEGKSGIYCENYYTKWDESIFEIKEVEVEGLNGEWFIDEFPNQNKKFLICSECRAVIDCSVCQIDENEFDFCPYCGADMRKGDK